MGKLSPELLVLLALALVVVGAQPAVASERVRLTSHPAEDRAPSWSPDGRHLLFASDRDGSFDIYAIDLDGSGLRRLTEDPATDLSPSWAPNGESFVFESDRDGANGLWIQEISTGTARKLLSDPSPELVPDWSPDGEWIAFTSQRTGNADLFRARVVDGSALERLTTSDYRDVWPRYSPTGDRLVFFSRRATEGRHDDLFVLDLESGAITQVTAHPDHHDFVPDWAPDGERLVAGMSDRRAGRRTLVIHSLADGVATPFAGGFHRVFQPSWSPDGRWIAYAARVADGEAADIYLERPPGATD